VSPTALILTLCLVGEGEPASDGSPQGPTAEATPAATLASLRYPLGVRPEPDFMAPAEPFKLVDLRVGLNDTDVTTHTFAARIKVKDWGYLGAEANGERRGLSATTERLSVALSSDQGAWSLGGSYRAPHFILSADALRRSDSEGGGWEVGQALSVRLSPDFELLGQARSDTSRPDDRVLRTVSAGFLWQWRTKLEALGEYRREYVATDADAENTIDSARLALVAQWGPAELRANGALTDTDGRFPRRDLEGNLEARVQVAPRLLAEGDAGGSVERGASTQSHAYRAALTWFGRRFTLPRAGQVAERSLALARKATAAGYNERRAFDDEGLRAQRERLALSPTRHELGEELAALYHAQVEERSVPLLGIEVRDRADSLSGEALRVAALFVGVPWPPAAPWRANESAVPFLRFGYEYERRTSGANFRARADHVTLTVSLDREMDLVVGWRRTEPTALDLIRGIGMRTTFEASYVYAFGR
jgi:hypothetical protein